MSDSEKFAALKAQLTAMWPSHEKTAQEAAASFVARALGLAGLSCRTIILCGPPGSGKLKACDHASRLLYGKSAFLFPLAETAVPHPDRDLPAELRSLAAREPNGIAVLDEIEKAPVSIGGPIMMDMIAGPDGRLHNLHIVLTSSLPPNRLVEWLRPEIAHKLGDILSLF